VTVTRSRACRRCRKYVARLTDNRSMA
jgi:hypothetical protein